VLCVALRQSAFHDDREVDYIWDEAEDGPWNVITESASHEDYYTIRAASFNKLIQRLTTPPAPEAEQAVHDNCTCSLSLSLSLSCAL